MPRPQPRPIRLSETQRPPQPDAQIIDANFRLVGRRTFFQRVRFALFAIVIAALVGFLTPPLILLAKALLASE